MTFDHAHSRQPQTVKCPRCGVDYLASVFVCNLCHVDLRTGQPLVTPKAREARRFSVGGITFALWTIGLAGLLAVLGSVFGWTWVAVMFGIGLSVALLLMIALFFPH